MLQKRFERTLRRLFARGIGVEAKDDFVHIAFEDARLPFGKRRPLRRDHVR